MILTIIPDISQGVGVSRAVIDFMPISSISLFISFKNFNKLIWEEKHKYSNCKVCVNYIKSANAKCIKECRSNINNTSKEGKYIKSNYPKSAFVESFSAKRILSRVKVGRVIRIKPIFLCFVKRKKEQSQVLQCQIKAQNLYQKLFDFKDVIIKSAIMNSIINIIKPAIGHRDMPVMISQDSEYGSTEQFKYSSSPYLRSWKNFFKILRGHDHVTYSI